jgi:hypothetical protein
MVMNTVPEMGAKHSKTANPSEAAAGVCARPVLMLPELIPIKERTEDWWTMSLLGLKYVA